MPAPLLLLHEHAGSAADWSDLAWPDEYRVVAVEETEPADVITLLEGLDSPAVLIGHGSGATTTTLVHTERPELVTAEIVIEPDYSSEDAIARAARRTRPTLGIFASESAAAVERAAGDADLVIWPGFGHALHREAPTAFVRTVTRWLARLG